MLPRLDPLTLVVAPQMTQKPQTPQTPQSPQTPVGIPNTQTLGELLLGFFGHYAELHMDQAVSVATASQVPRPGSCAFKRFCILDPLTPGEDLGRHLTPKTLPVLRRELARARLQLASGTALAYMINATSELTNAFRQVIIE